MKCYGDLSKKKKNIKSMNRKMKRNLQLSITEPKKPKTKQTTRTVTESQKGRSHEGLSVAEWEGKRSGKDTGNKKHKW